MTETHGQSLSDANAHLSQLLQHLWQDDVRELVEGDSQIGALMGGNGVGEARQLYLPLDADLIQHWQPAQSIAHGDLLMIQLLRVLQKAFNYEPARPEPAGPDEPVADTAGPPEPAEDDGTGTAEGLEGADSA